MSERIEDRRRASAPAAGLIADLRARRRSARITLKKLGRQIGVSWRSILAWERGDRWPYPEHLFGWANALGCDVRIVPLNEEPRG